MKRYERDLRISSNDDEIMVKAEILWTEDEVSGNNSISIKIVYANKEYWGFGTDYCWIDAFADLQNKFPENVKIECCLTCRFGNLCPVGNVPDEIFCTKDVEIKEKSDLWFYTEDDVERKKRSRNTTYLCQDYCAQAENFYTYNDFLYWLNKTKE